MSTTATGAELPARSAALCVLPNVGFVVYMDFSLAIHHVHHHGAEKAGDAEVDNKTLT